MPFNSIILTSSTNLLDHPCNKILKWNIRISWTHIQKLKLPFPKTRYYILQLFNLSPSVLSETASRLTSCISNICGNILHNCCFRLRFNHGILRQKQWEKRHLLRIIPSNISGLPSAKTTFLPCISGQHIVIKVLKYGSLGPPHPPSPVPCIKSLHAAISDASSKHRRQGKSQGGYTWVSHVLQRTEVKPEISSH